MLALAVIGLGGSIYHPVGIAWVVRNAENPGRILGINGIFGAVGVGLAGLVAGSLTSWIDWRAAFWIPGALSIAMGLGLWALIALGFIVDPGSDRSPQQPAAKADRMRAFVVLSITMLCAGLLFQSLQTAMPKIVEVDMRGMLGLAAGEAPDTARIGGIVTIIYLLTSGAQVLGGLAADRFEPRRVYVVALAIQVPAVLLATQMADLSLFFALTALIFMNSMQLPAETVLLARYTPERHRGFAFGLKFVLSFASGPVAVWLVAATYGLRGDFLVLLLTLGALATLAAMASWILPPPRQGVTAQPA
jgi:MFS family permease